MYTQNDVKLYYRVKLILGLFATILYYSLQLAFWGIKFNHCLYVQTFPI
jgi:hypothetical protein